MGGERSQDIRDRTFRFACRVGRLAIGSIPKPGTRVILDQLVRSGTSVGANLEEAKATSSRREFIRFAEISLREAREASYWLRICRVLDVGDATELTDLQDEADQIARILGSIVLKTKRLTE